jgi:hypothetical protein
VHCRWRQLPDLIQVFARSGDCARFGNDPLKAQLAGMAEHDLPDGAFFTSFFSAAFRSISGRFRRSSPSSFKFEKCSILLRSALKAQL